jgi:hypothetical protein
MDEIMQAQASLMPAVAAEAGAAAGLSVKGNCANCGASLVGVWCQDCGQHRDATHRSVGKLCLEAFEHLINTDGKILTTLRQLFMRPAALTKNYLAGHRAAQVPPVTLFLVVLVGFLFVAAHTTNVEMPPMTPATEALVPSFMKWSIPVSNVLRQHESSFLTNLSESAELFGLLTVPVAAVLLWGLFAWPRRGVVLYDHLIFALHSLSFQFIMLAVLSLTPDAISLPLMAVMAGHLFLHMRGTYGSGVSGTLLRMALLGLGTLIASLALLVLWLAVAYAELWM